MHSHHIKDNVQQTLMYSPPQIKKKKINEIKKLYLKKIDRKIPRKTFTHHVINT